MEPVRLTPTLGSIVRQIGMHARDHRFAMTPLAQKAVAVMQVGDLGLQDGELSAATAGWFSVLGSAGAFFAIISRGLCNVIPLRSAIEIASGAFVGDNVLEAYPQLMHRLSFSRELLTPRKTTAFSAMSSELITVGGPQGQQVIQDAINLAVRLATDADVYDELSGSAYDGALASGVTGAACLNDLRTALKAVFSAGQSTVKAFWIMSPMTAITLSTLAAASGPLLFPDMSVSGGSLLGAPALVSGGWGEHALTLVDGSQIAGGGDSLGIDASAAAAYSAALSPTNNAGTASGAEQLISAFQSDTIMVRAQVRFTLGVARPTAVFTIAGADTYAN